MMIYLKSISPSRLIEYWLIVHLFPLTDTEELVSSNSQDTFTQRNQHRSNKDLNITKEMNIMSDKL